jgi:hypothetical protein
MRNFAFSCLLFACLFGVGSLSAQHTPSTTGYSTIEPSNWSFQCFYDSTCGVNWTGAATWINTESQPGTVRLWNAGTAWYNLETASGTYDWSTLDAWLDMIAEHQPTQVIYTFGNTPCWISSTKCSGTGWAALWTPSPPSDLSNSGSPAFTAFVTALTQHCSPAGNCVEKYINIFEMWNEANLPPYWTGTPAQLYNMFAPAVKAIHANCPKAAVSTPPVAGGDTTWMGQWLSLENTNGRLSNYYGFHAYLHLSMPEQRINMAAKMVETKNDNGWTNVPWMNSETNFQPQVYTCASNYTIEECDGMLVRWHVLLYAYDGGPGGAFNVGWFDWPSITTGSYDTYYYTMMQWLNGATFTGSCTSTGGMYGVYTCPLKEGNGKSALIVWNPEGSSQYTPGTQYVDYRGFNGTYGGQTVKISAGESTTIGVIPIMFEIK